MERRRFTEEQVAFALWQAEAGTLLEEVCRRMGASEPTFHRWGRRFAAMGVAEVRRMRQLEDEDHKLKQLAAGLTLDNAMLQDVLRRRW